MKSPSEDTHYGTYSYNGCLRLEHFKPFAFPPCVLTIVSLPVDMATHASAPVVEPTAATTSHGAAPIAGIAASTPAIASTVPSTASMNAPGASNIFVQYSAQQLASAPPLDPALEALLRSVNLCEELIGAFRVQEVTDRELFVALDTSEESLRDTCKEAFGVDSTKGFTYKRELGKIIKAWSNAKVHSDTKLKIDAVARSHGEPVSMLCADWESLMVTFKNKYGTHLHDTVLPSQSYYEAFEERLANGQFRAEPLNHVVSVHEQEDQESKKPETQRHMSLHLDGQLTIQTKRRFTSSMPTNPEELRQKYKIMTHCWLLAQMRQPGRHLFSDFTRMTFNRFLG